LRGEESVLEKIFRIFNFIRKALISYHVVLRIPAQTAEVDLAGTDFVVDLHGAKLPGVKLSLRKAVI
jgi:hypothetical protein